MAGTEVYIGTVVAIGATLELDVSIEGGQVTAMVD